MNTLKHRTTPVFRIPAEIWTQILTAAYQHRHPFCTFSTLTSSRPLALDFAHVCRWFRNLVFNVPTVWACIHPSPHRTHLCDGMLARQLELSARRPLSIAMTLTDVMEDLTWEDWALLWNHRERFDRLAIWVEERQLHEIIEQVQAATSLSYFYITTWRQPKERYHSDAFYKGGYDSDNMGDMSDSGSSGWSSDGDYPDATTAISRIPQKFPALQELHAALPVSLNLLFTEPASAPFPLTELWLESIASTNVQALVDVLGHVGATLRSFTLLKAELGPMPPEPVLFPFANFPALSKLCLWQISDVGGLHTYELYHRVAASIINQAPSLQHLSLGLVPDMAGLSRMIADAPCRGVRTLAFWNVPWAEEPSRDISMPPCGVGFATIFPNVEHWIITDYSDEGHFQVLEPDLRQLPYFAYSAAPPEDGCQWTRLRRVTCYDLPDSLKTTFRDFVKEHAAHNHLLELDILREGYANAMPNFQSVWTLIGELSVPPADEYQSPRERKRHSLQQAFSSSSSHA